MSNKKAVIIAGPNGAGKTTFARTFLPVEAALPNFINADLIASGLSPFAPEAAAIKAGRLMLHEIRRNAEQGKSFSLETTLSGTGYLSHVSRWRRLGYHVTLYFLQLSDVSMAINRVAQRVEQGGHHIPEDVIRRRFRAGLANLPAYQNAVNDWIVYDNSDDMPLLVDWGENP